MFRNVFRSMMVLSLIVGLVLSNVTVSANSLGTCSNTIVEAKHTVGNETTASSDCSGHIFGYVTPSSPPSIVRLITKTVSNGEIVEFSIPRQGRYEMTITE